MFYAYLRGLVVFLLWIINGNAHYHNRNKLLDKDENYILVAPHRTWWDPVYMAFSARPKQFIFMAKKELFKSRIFGWWIRMCGAFPIDRENPGQEAIKYPVNMLKKSNRSLIMFPSGSRHSSDVKGKVVFLTFDDGIDPTLTPQVMNILKEYGVHATFFHIGYTITSENGDILKRQITEDMSLPTTVLAIISICSIQDVFQIKVRLFLRLTKPWLISKPS